MENGFTEDDKNKLIELLNFIAQKATFNGWKTEDTIKHFKLLSHAQSVILPKIEAHILEVKKVIQTSETPETEKASKKTRG